ncbi:WD40 repeat-like protein [Exidia glandulosa HHB12029]|uniref:WD40 repeat-like protein n=1 Tax=Exidia glandulosa HHB12029 TaxID=1314781 RepID=A0A165N0Z9_EXIGL|nr:WD40 repeat-like protein [Exidia glandulosa HHB12029]
MDLENLVDDVDYALGGSASERARAENQALLDELERKKKARTMAVPTDDGRVRARLREIGEPITLFGERAPDRRDRLIYVLSQINAAKGGDAMDVDAQEESSSDDDEEEFYTAGDLELLEARRRMAEYSIPRARARVQYQREESKIPLQKVIDIRKKVFTELKTLSIYGSQVGDERPLSQVRFSPDGKYLATGSWAGNVKVWNVPACTPVKSWHGHADRVGGVAWHPDVVNRYDDNVLHIASGGEEGGVTLWSMKSDEPLTVMKGHVDRVARIAFHPSGHYIASASFDTSWRLWDVELGKSLLVQEGHSRAVYAVDCQDDGALVASGGLDGIGRVWDLRSGRTAMVLDGHLKAIFSMNFAPNSYQIATGSGDDTVRIWDMRTLKALHIIPAHKSNVVDVRYFRGSYPAPDAADRDAQYRTGLYFATAGYDGLVRVWSADDWQLVKSVATDAGKVMSVDISPDKQFIAAGSWNRSFQLFTPDTSAADV